MDEGLDPDERCMGERMLDRVRERERGRWSRREEVCGRCNEEDDVVAVVSVA